MTTKEQQRVIDEEAEAERVYQEGQRRAPKPAPEPEPEPEPEPKAPPELQALVSGDNPMGPQILRVAPCADPALVNYYVLGVGPPYAGVARWIELAADLPPERAAGIILARMGGLPDPVEKDDAQQRKHGRGRAQPSVEGRHTG